MIRSVLWFLVLAAGFGMMLASTRWLGGSAATMPATAAAAVRVGPATFCVYVGGMALLLLGGSALLMRLYEALVSRRSAWSLNSPLVVMYKYRRLLCAMHVAYFGVFVLFAAAAYAAPETQQALLKAIGREIRSGSGPLRVVGQAYLSRNVALAALVTLGVNFLIGSFLSITVPSAVLPGVGVAMAGFRAALWGLILAPTSVGLCRVMLPHSLTLLLEGEAYILASFFAVLIPIYLFRRSEGATPAGRYARALVLNLRASLAVLIVLSAAAVYEAIEVIWMME